MKLITKFTLSYLLVSALVFILGFIISYKMMEHELETEQFWEMHQSFNYVVERINLGVQPELLNSNEISIVELPSSSLEKELTISDTMVWADYNRQFKSYKKGVCQTKIYDKVYQISIHNIIIERDDISEATTMSLSIIFGLLTLLTYLSSLILSRIFLTPFHQTLKTIQNFDLTKNDPIILSSSKTDEFNQLNEFVQSMSQKAQQEYQSLKSFSENSSHEMQTPLAIIRGKLELLLSTKLDKKQVQLIEASYNATEYLSQLNKALTLLTKVENHEFTTQKTLDFSQLLVETIHDYEDMIDLQGISLTTNISPNIQIQMHPSLAYILISNLLSNAIKHNLSQNGAIVIDLNKQSFIIKNTGLMLDFSPQELFRRFNKGNQSSASIGLGLAIVKSICDKNDLDIHYHTKKEWHVLELTL